MIGARLASSVLCMALLVALPAGAAELEDFFGRYEGTAISGSAEGLTKRDLSVTIEGRQDGFSVSWTTTTPGNGSKPKRKSYTIEFERTNQAYLFESAMRKDMFGNRVPLNPMKGDPYVWATLHGDTLTVYSLIITDSGSYELQQYDRTLTEDGLRLEFSRIREGRELKRITGRLEKVSG